MVPKRKILGLFFLFVLFVPVGIFASEEGKTIELSVGECTVRGCGKDTWLVSVGNPAVADVELKKAGKRTYALIKAKALGKTNVVICEARTE